MSPPHTSTTQLVLGRAVFFYVDHHEDCKAPADTVRVNDNLRAYQPKEPIWQRMEVARQNDRSQREPRHPVSL